MDVGAAFALGYYALVDLHAGFASIVLALVPLATLLLACFNVKSAARPPPSRAPSLRSRGSA